MLDRHAIAARLREIASLLELTGGNKFKARAFARGARAIEATREPIGALVDEQRLTELPGIGFAIARQVEELHRTGRSEVLESLKKGLPSGVVELSQVEGIGLHALRVLAEELGVETVEDLKAAAEAGRLRHVKGFGEKKEARVLEAVRRYETKRPRVLLADGLRLAESLERELLDVDGVRSADLAGSLRRSVELANDIDFVVTTDDPYGAIDRIVRLPRVAKIEVREGARCRLRVADGTRVDVWACKPEDRAATLVVATGSPLHVARLRAIASERGLEVQGAPDDSAPPPEGAREARRERPPVISLVDRRRRRSVALEDEHAFYEELGLAFVPPELREDLGEIEQATRGEEPELVTMEDVRGFVHCHSTWSDGRHSIEEMARAAEARGASFITITDHSRAAHYAGGLDVDRLRRQWDEIDEVQERVGIRLLKGTEADILADGAIDWPDRILERLDVVIASIHARHRQDEDAMTKRLLRAMKQPIFKIWGHPLGRLVTTRPPVPCRVEEILDALARSRGAIEINGDPRRLDLEPRWVRAARERGLSFVLSVDAHSARELENLRYAVGLARRGGVLKSEVLNARTPAAFAKAVRPTPKRRSAA